MTLKTLTTRLRRNPQVPACSVIVEARNFLACYDSVGCGGDDAADV